MKKVGNMSLRMRVTLFAAMTMIIACTILSYFILKNVNLWIVTYEPATPPSGSDIIQTDPYTTSPDSTDEAYQSASIGREYIALTTLNITTDRESLVNFIQQLLSPKEKTPIPEWAREIQFGDDAEQHTIISDREETIAKAQADIEAAKQKLAENEKYKSILYTNGDELVHVVFSILDQLLDCDLSHFVDEKKEDFLIQKESCTFIGEIKGVTSNVRNEHVSQVDVHYQSYMDKLQEENRTENVSQLLIINPFRTKALSEREPVHEQQIALAQRNGCLIIETSTLLRVYEKFLKGDISSAQCVNTFSINTGLLEESAFDQQ